MAKHKTIKNWKVVKSGLSFTEAAEIYENQTLDGKPVENVSIRIGNKQYIKDPIYGVANFTSERFYPKEFASHCWEALIPDTDEEERCEKVRTLMKNSCCSCLTNARIDNLTIEEMYDWISSHLNKDQKYRMLLAYYDKMIYKTK